MVDPVVYIAGRFASRLRLRSMRESVRALGFTCASSWMDDSDGDYPVPRVRSLAAARQDMAELSTAALLILDTLDEDITGGREVELGLHLCPVLVGAATPRTRPVVLIGPVRNVFHELAEWRCRDWSDGLEVLADLRATLFA